MTKKQGMWRKTGPSNHMDEAWVAGEIEKYIARDGFSIIALEQLSYTAGLYRSYRHPEICVLGLDQDRGCKILTVLGKMVATGRRMNIGDRVPGVLAGYEVTFAPVTAEQRDEWFEVTSLTVYKDEAYSAIQAVFPDEDNRFPGEVGCDPETAQLQSWEGLTAFVNFQRDVN